MPRTTAVLRQLATALIVAAVTFSTAIPAENVPSRSWSARIDGRVGGFIRGTNWGLTVPAGAYDGVATITMVETFGGFPVAELEISDPKLNSFKVPVVLSFRFGMGSNAAGKAMFWWDAAGRRWVQLPSSADARGSLIKTSLSHFSTYSVQRSGKAGW